MKKLYNAPVINYVEIELPPVMVLRASLPTNGLINLDRVSSTTNTADETIGGSWENIWNE